MIKELINRINEKNHFYEKKYSEHIEVIRKLNLELNTYQGILISINNVIIHNNIILGIQEINKHRLAMIYRSYYEPEIWVVNMKNSDIVLCRILISERSNYIYIHDIYSYGFINQGYGSIAMEYLIKEGKKLNKEYLIGEISYVDHDHINRLKHFYKKHGFEIQENGCVKKYL